jgi:hypothetical protein
VHVDIVDQRMHVLVPACKIVCAILAAAAGGPGFGLPTAALDHAHEVEEFSPAQRVGDDVAAGADPIGADRAPQPGRQPIGRDHPTPGDASGECGIAGAERPVSDFGMNSIRADHQSAVDRTAICQYRGCKVAVIPDIDDFRA